LAARANVLVGSKKITGAWARVVAFGKKAVDVKDHEPAAGVCSARLVAAHADYDAADPVTSQRLYFTFRDDIAECEQREYATQIIEEPRRTRTVDRCVHGWRTGHHAVIEVIAVLAIQR
jgi:hypothetical protein